MKKIFFIVAIATISMVSCNNEKGNELSSNISELNKEQAFAKLNSQINEFNTVFFLQYPQQNLQRGFWKKLFTVLKADVQGAGTGAGVGAALGGHAGAVAGAVTGAVVYSVDAVINLPTTSSEPPTNSGYIYCVISNAGNPNLVIDGSLIDSQNYSIENNIGYYHNLIIKELLEENPTILNASFDDLFNAVLGKVSLLFPKEIQGINVNELKKQIKSNLNRDLPIILEEYNSFPVLAEMYPERDNEIVIIDNFFNNFSTLSPELRPTYAAGMIEIVRNSEISSLSSLTLTSAISVAINSSLLWNIEE